MRNDPTLRAERAGAMGQGLPLDPAAGHRRRLDAAGAVAGAAADPRDRRAAARRCLGGDADARHRGRDPHHAGRDQARLPVSRDDRHRAADAGTGRDRRADRHALHRDQQDRRGAVRRQDLSGGRFRLGRRHRQARQRRGVGRPAADFAAGERQGEEELLRASAARPTCISGASRCSIRRSRRCG